MTRFSPVRSQCQFDTPGERRSALEVALVSGAFATELFTSRDTDKDDVPIIAPESAGRRAVFPELIHYEGRWQEWGLPVTRIRDELANGRALQQHSDFTSGCKRRVAG